MDRQSAVLNEVVRISLLEKVRCDQRLEEGGRVSCTDIWGKDTRAGGGSSLREGLWRVACQMCLGKSKRPRAELLEQREWRSWRYSRRSGDKFI